MKQVLLIEWTAHVAPGLLRLLRQANGFLELLVATVDSRDRPTVLYGAVNRSKNGAKYYVGNNVGHA